MLLPDTTQGIAIKKPVLFIAYAAACHQFLNTAHTSKQLSAGCPLLLGDCATLAMQVEKYFAGRGVIANYWIGLQQPSLITNTTSYTWQGGGSVGDGTTSDVDPYGE